jgi:diaminopimelate decarboxylase
MDLVNTLIERYFGVSDGELLIGGIPVTALAARYGTPLYIYDRGVIDEKLTLLRDTLPPEFTIHYSVKANPNPAILKHFIRGGCGLEIASAGELQLALTAGCPPGRVLFAGPGKTEADLECAVSHNIGEIHVESLLEAERIGNICHRLGKRAGVALRVNPGGEAQGGAMRMGGKPAPFGVDEETLETVLNPLLTESCVDFRGIHLFSGTQILDPVVLVNQYRKGLAIGKKIADRIQRPLLTIDFGGGLGIPYFPNEEQLDMKIFKERLARLFKEIDCGWQFKGTKFVVEPGRYLIGEAGIYVARVTDIKTSRGKKFVILDGGMNHHLAASGNLGQVIKRNFPIAILNKMNEGPRETMDVVGPLCTPLDTLARDVELPAPGVGDLIGLFQSGAYARTASPLGFLSHLTPAEVLVTDCRAHLIRARGTIESLFAGITCEELANSD